MSSSTPTTPSAPATTSTNITVKSEIKVNIKASNDQKYALSITPSDTTVLQLKQHISTLKGCEAPPERMRLIYSGRVLKDMDTLDAYKVQDGHTIHLVRSAVAPSKMETASLAPRTTTPSATAATAQDPSMAGTAAFPNPWATLSNPGGTGTGTGTRTEVPSLNVINAMNAMTSGMSSTMGGMEPMIMSQMMQDPNFAQYMSSMLQNPQVLESMISMNPALQAMGPEARLMLRSPLFQQMIANPDMLQRVAQMQMPLGGGSGSGMMGGMGSMGSEVGGGGGGGMFHPWANAGSPAAAAAANGASPANHTPVFNPFAAFGPTAGANNSRSNPMASLLAQQMAALSSSSSSSPSTSSGLHRPSTSHQQSNQQSSQQQQESPQQPSQQTLEERFQVQLKQLNEMGFWDASKNVRALMAAGGNVNGAVEILFSRSA
ncbi:hypothetical protein EDD11_002294 [Mortierella claussenii]|nr:hypothetical protein EDD11_002294 [Mortierella claussenii]